MRTKEVRVSINTENAVTEYTMLVEVEDIGEPDERIHKVLGSSLLLGASLLDARWSGDGQYRVTPEQEPT